MRWGVAFVVMASLVACGDKSDVGSDTAMGPTSGGSGATPSTGTETGGGGGGPDGTTTGESTGEPVPVTSAGGITFVDRAPSGQFILTAATARPTAKKELEVFGKIVSVTDEPLCLVRFDADILDAGGRVIGSDDNFISGSVRKMEGMQTGTCLMPGESGEFFMRSTSVFDAVSTISYAIRWSTSLSEEPDTEVVITAGSMSAVDAGTGRLNLEGELTNTGSEDAWFDGSVVVETFVKDASGEYLDWRSDSTFVDPQRFSVGATGAFVIERVDGSEGNTWRLYVNWQDPDFGTAAFAVSEEAGLRDLRDAEARALQDAVEAR